MKIQVGDKVKFLNDTGGGTVVKIVDEKTAMVLTEDGFDFPFALNELLIDEDARNDNTSDSQEPQKREVRTVDDLLDDEEEIVSKDDEEVNIYLAFVPEDASKPTSSHQQLN
ncbi:MAG: hypothetical protein U9Q83_03945, partial [Bacteroidota bacterium]|nr:hypothetical protein [Bacteroidota bacterium]